MLDPAQSVPTSIDENEPARERSASVGPLPRMLIGMTVADGEWVSVSRLEYTYTFYSRLMLTISS